MTSSWAKGILPSHLLRLQPKWPRLSHCGPSCTPWALRAKMKGWAQNDQGLTQHISAPLVFGLCFWTPGPPHSQTLEERTWEHLSSIGQEGDSTVRIWRSTAHGKGKHQAGGGHEVRSSRSGGWGTCQREPTTYSRTYFPSWSLSHALCASSREAFLSCVALDKSLHYPEP